MIDVTKIPTSAEDLNKLVKLNINLNNISTFQTMHIEIGDRYAYTIIAKFNGVKMESSYKIEQIDFKFINISGFGDGLCIHNVDHYLDSNNNLIHKFELYIDNYNPEMGNTMFQESDRMKYYTFTLNKEIIVTEENILDIHMNENFYNTHNLLIKGRQCNSSVYF